MNHDLNVRGLDFDTPEFLDWNPENPLDCDVWATANIGTEEAGSLFHLHICTPASIRRIENKRHCFLIEHYTGKADLITRLNAFIAEKTNGRTEDPYWVLSRLWRWEYGKYDKRGQLVD